MGAGYSVRDISPTTFLFRRGHELSSVDTSIGGRNNLRCLFTGLSHDSAVETKCKEATVAMRVPKSNPERDRGKALVNMENTPCCSIAVGRLTLLCIVLVAIWEPRTHAQQDTGAVHIPLAVEQVVKNLEESARRRTHALHRFEGIRVYRLQYRGLLGDRDAEMVVRVAYQSPATKEFTVISQSGSKFIIDRIFKKLLESEQEALRPENQEPTTLNTENYVFGLAGYE